MCTAHQKTHTLILGYLVYCRDRSERCLTIRNAMSEPALHALVGLDNITLEAISLVRDEPLRRAESSFALTAHSRYRKEIVRHDCERWIEVLASFTPPPERLVDEAVFYDLTVHDCRDRCVEGVFHEAIKLGLL